MKLFAYVSIMLGPAQIIMYDCVFVVQLISISFGTASEYVAYSWKHYDRETLTLFVFWPFVRGTTCYGDIIPLTQKNMCVCWCVGVWVCVCVCVWGGGGGFWRDSQVDADGVHVTSFDITVV